MKENIILFNDKTDCCGCWACENICPKNAITMIEDKEGFLFPEIDQSKCIKCGLCLKTCPIKKRQKEEADPSTASKKKYIKIINLHMTKNYGASIAAACLEDQIRKLVSSDITVKTVNYSNYSIYEEKPLLRFREKIYDNEGIVNSIKLLITPNKSIMSSNETVCRNENYKKFENLFLNLTVLMNNYNLMNDTDNNVAVICGSDVIWHTKRIISDKSYAFCLRFAEKNTIKIAYAPSIDCKSSFKLNAKSPFYKKRLSGIDYISIRENSSVPFIKKQTKKDVFQCCDPALLFDAEYYNKMISMANIENSDNNSDYIYAYVLGQNKDIADYVKNLSEKKKLKVLFYSDTNNDFGNNSQNCFSDGPCEFLYRVRNAKYVVTTSFHCVVFSLLFKKQFLTFQRNKYSIKTLDLLASVDLSERLVNTTDCIPCIDDNIDYDKVYEKIETSRESSIKFLENALASLK